MAVECILLDIEGTTSSISFVKETLFPYARTHLPDFVRRHAAEPEVRAALDAVPADDDGSKVATLLRWIDEDRKETPLKSLQGLVWRRGYEDGSLLGHVYSDTPPALQRWKDAGLVVAIYSSGSVGAQRLLFGHSRAGDLLPLIDHHFDTRVGAKTEPTSYGAIAAQLGVTPQGIQFASDVERELDAARAAGLSTVQVVRDEDGTLPSTRHPTVADLSRLPVPPL
jgi:enolase-phosphatase E1